MSQLVVYLTLVVCHWSLVIMNSIRPSL